MNINVEFEGKVVEMFVEKTGLKKDGTSWVSQGYVVEVPDAEYPQKIYFEIFGREKINQCSMKVNDFVHVKASVASHEYNGRWFTNIRAWSVTNMAVAAPVNAPTPVGQIPQSQAQPARPAPQPQSSVDEDFDLPF